jgi:adenylate cyclase
MPLLKEAVARDPTYARAWATLAQSEAIAASWNWSKDRAESRRNAQEALRRALALDGADPIVMAFAAITSVYLGRDPRAAEAMAERALAINPGSVTTWNTAGVTNTWAGHPERALARLEHAIRLDPRSPSRFAPMMNMGFALVTLERLDEAATWLEEALTLKPDVPGILYGLVEVYARLGRTDDAKAMLARAETAISARDFISGHIRPVMADRQAPIFRSLGADV